MATAKSTTAKSAATPKAVVEKPAATKKTSTASSKKASTSKSKSSAGSSDSSLKISPEERYRMVEVAAYFLAERNAFAGSPVEYWSTAEAQINKLLSK